ncbi:serine/threonine-protein kinase tnni3k-related [Anaeramoeba flamelloides]|uniref:Serine/threonine-protein kinase tnni3k-related n=1 Tax=Anaeramoeba flamelloides TaxID=1746091 RepID=A0AAV7YJ70_9EUKA|nr:serine/threonine-protein kinase tnni3k-related [Anaeramoeba flamelloides]
MTQKKINKGLQEKVGGEIKRKEPENEKESIFQTQIIQIFNKDESISISTLEENYPNYYSFGNKKKKTTLTQKERNEKKKKQENKRENGDNISPKSTFSNGKTIILTRQNFNKDESISISTLEENYPNDYSFYNKKKKKKKHERREMKKEKKQENKRENGDNISPKSTFLKDKTIILMSQNFNKDESISISNLEESIKKKETKHHEVELEKKKNKGEEKEQEQGKDVDEKKQKEKIKNQSDRKRTQNQEAKKPNKEQEIEIPKVDQKKTQEMETQKEKENYTNQTEKKKEQKVKEEDHSKDENEQNEKEDEYENENENEEADGGDLDVSFYFSTFKNTFSNTSSYNSRKFLSSTETITVDEDDDLFEKYVFNSYELPKKGDYLGEGTFGNVFKTRVQNNPAVIKILNIEPKNKSINSQFKNEVSILFKLRHPNLVSIIGMCYDPYSIIMEYCNYGSLRDYFLKMETEESKKESNSKQKKSKLKSFLEKKQPKKELNWKQKIKLALDITYGLRELHRLNILHLDLKPGNILLHIESTKEIQSQCTTDPNQDNSRFTEKIIKEENSTITAKICDFGVSKFITSNPNGNTKKQKIGTHRYMSPEMLNPKITEYNKKCDIYSLGIIFYELSTNGKVPFQEIKDKEVFERKIRKGERDKIPEDTPKKFEELIKLCWNPNPEKRPKINKITYFLKQCLEKLDIEKDTNQNDSEEEKYKNLTKKKRKKEVGKSYEFKWGIPNRNKNPVERIELLEKIEQYFNTEMRGKTIILLISGLSGIGKTHLCIEYIDRHSKYYDQIFWFNSESEEKLIQDFQNLSNDLNPYNQSDNKKNLAKKTEGGIEILKRLSNFLNYQTNNVSKLKRLIVFDNVDTLLKKMYFNQINGDILLTSQSELDMEMIQIIPIKVNNFSIKETAQYFEKNAFEETHKKMNGRERKKFEKYNKLFHQLLGGFLPALKKVIIPVHNEKFSLKTQFYHFDQIIKNNEKFFKEYKKNHNTNNTKQLVEDNSNVTELLKKWIEIRKEIKLKKSKEIEF